MLWSLVKNTQWAPMLDLLSPAFFDVVPSKMLFGELKGLTTRYLGRSAYREACASRSAALSADGLPFEIAATIASEPAPTLDKARGEDVLALNFHQVLGEGPALLDLRRAAFQRSGDHWLWKPEPAIASWSEDFRVACRALYEGFYLDDPARFSSGARALGLGEAEAEIRAQFGDTHNVTFSLRDFQQKFHQVFQRCKQTRSQLHPGFLTLGLGLATLYEHLEQISSPLDVHAAFLRIHGARAAA